MLPPGRRCRDPARCRCREQRRPEFRLISGWWRTSDHSDHDHLASLKPGLSTIAVPAHTSFPTWNTLPPHDVTRCSKVEIGPESSHGPCHRALGGAGYAINVDRRSERLCLRATFHPGRSSFLILPFCSSHAGGILFLFSAAVVAGTLTVLLAAGTLAQGNTELTTALQNQIHKFESAGLNVLVLKIGPSFVAVKCQKLFGKAWLNRQQPARPTTP